MTFAFRSRGQLGSECQIHSTRLIAGRLAAPERIRYTAAFKGTRPMTDMANDETTGTVSGGVKTLLRLEGLVLFAGATLVYSRSDAPWWLYAVLFLAPDLSFLGYLAGPKIGAWAYNAVHSTLAPIAIFLAIKLGSISAYFFPIALIWLAHIGFDRTVGYGLKYERGFGFTHLGRIGKDAAKV